jgi:hypothetical protein
MIDILEDELRLAIQQVHGCPSRLLECVPLPHTKYCEQVVGGAVHVFELLGHPSAAKCYAWAAPSKTSSTVMHAVLHSEFIHSPELAVKQCRTGKDAKHRPYAPAS